MDLLQLQPQQDHRHISVKIDSTSGSFLIHKDDNFAKGSNDR